MKQVTEAARRKYDAWLAQHPEYEPMSFEEAAYEAAIAPTRRRLHPGWGPARRREVAAENALYEELYEGRVQGLPSAEAPDDGVTLDGLQQTFVDAQARATGYEADPEDNEPSSLYFDEDEAADESGFDRREAKREAKTWQRRMANERQVLLGGRGGLFKRAVCGLTNEPGHRHVRYCAGPSAAERRLQATTRRG